MNFMDINFTNNFFKNLQFEKFPKDIKKLIIGNMKLNHEDIIELIKCDDSNELISGNIELWRSLWHGYISSVIDVQDLKVIELKKMFIEAFNLYDLDPLMIIKMKNMDLGDGFYKTDDPNNYEIIEQRDYDETIKKKIISKNIVKNLKHNKYNVIIKNSKAIIDILNILNVKDPVLSKKDDYDIIKKLLDDVVYLSPIYLHIKYQGFGLIGPIFYNKSMSDRKFLNILFDYRMQKTDLNGLLLQAGLQRNVEVFKLLLSGGSFGIKHAADVNSSVHLFVVDELIDTLIEYNYDFNKINNDGKNIMFYYGELSSSSIKKMVEMGANINMQNKYGASPILSLLKSAISIKNKIDKIKILLENGANINITNNDGETVLHIISTSIFDNDLPNAVDFLLKNGANPNIKNNKNQNPLDELISYGFYTVGPTYHKAIEMLKKVTHN